MGNPQDWRERIIGALGAVLAVALVIGGVIGVVAYGAARMAGLTGGDDTSSASPEAGPSSPSPSGHESTATASPSPQHQGDVEQARQKHKPVHHHAHELTLVASPRQVHRMSRVQLSGTYSGHGGSLVVQRREGGHWDRFPVTVSLRGGHFHTWVASGYPGRNLFRVVDPATGKSSAPVTITVH